MDPCKTNFLYVTWYNDVRLSFGPSCVLLDARGRQTYQLTAFKPQPQLSQKHNVIVKITATRSLLHCIMHPREASRAICRAPADTRYLGIASEFIQTKRPLMTGDGKIAKTLLVQIRIPNAPDSPT